MQIEKANWMMVEEYLKTDDRIVFVLGATEEHGYNSLSTDTQCTWEIAKEACERQNVLLSPPLHFGPSAFSLAFPGTVSLRNETYLDVIRDMIDSVARVGFKKILFFSGHGGNMRAKEAITEYLLDGSDLILKFREWYLLPKTYARIMELGSTAWDHASWLESFPWINQPVEIPDNFKEQVFLEDDYALSPEELRSSIGDGVFGGKYTQPEPVMREFYELAVTELEDFLQNGWDRFLKTAPLKAAAVN
jgi:creatinine amidohydrolase